MREISGRRADLIDGPAILDRLDVLTSRVLLIAAENDYTPLAEKVALAKQLHAEIVVVKGSRHGTPFDSASLPVHLPFESKLDRVVIIAITFVWLGALLVGGRTAPKLRSSPLNWAVGAFVLAAVTSILVNASQLVNLDELSLSRR